MGGGGAGGVLVGGEGGSVGEMMLLPGGGLCFLVVAVMSRICIRRGMLRNRGRPPREAPK